MSRRELRHAGLLALRCGGTWRGALVEGPSGVGKSDLTLRCLDAGLRLVADDRTLVFTSAGRLFGRAPATIAGLIEARGVGILAEPALPLAPVDLLVRCCGADLTPERAPEPCEADLLGVAVPLLQLRALEPSAPAKLRRALEYLWTAPGGRRI